MRREREEVEGGYRPATAGGRPNPRARRLKEYVANISVRSQKDFIMTTNFLRNLVLTAALGGFAASPALASTTHDYNHNVNFRSYHTFSFMKMHSDDPFVEQRLEAELTRDLTKAGYQRVASGGDLQITAFEGEHDQKQYSTFYDGLGEGGWGWGGWGGWGGGWGGDGIRQTQVQEVPVGTLLVDMYDTHTHQLVWRGRASNTLSNNAEKNTHKFDNDIDHMLNGFPPPSKG
jgi:hypothetical protein